MAGFFDFIKKPTQNASAGTAPQPQIPQVVKPVIPQSPQVQNINNIIASVNSSVSPPVKPVSVQSVSPGQSVKPLVTPANIGTKPLTSNIDAQKRAALDLMTHLTQRSNRVFLSAQTKAKELEDEFIDSEHLLHGLLSDGEIYKLLTELKLQPQLVEAEIAPLYKRGGNKLNPPQNSPRLKRILDNSLVVARKLGFEFISPEHLLLALFEEGEGIGARVLSKLGLKKEDLNKIIVGKKEGLMEDQKAAEKKKSSIEQYTIDLTAKAAQGLLDPVVERYETIERVIHILSRRSKNNPALVGEAGVGKTAIVEGLAEKIVAKQVPESLLNKRILSLDLMAVLAGASHRGEFEERMKNLLDEVKANKGQIILFIDEIHNIMGAGGGEGSSDAANFLKPALSRGEMQLIGATTLTEYRKYIEKDPALERRFQPIVVPEPTEEQAIKMLKAIKGKYEAFHRVQIPDSAIEAAVKLSKRYVGDRFLPDKAVDLIDEAASAVRLPLLSLPENIRSLETRIAELNQETKESEKSGDPVKVRVLHSKIAEITSELNEKKDDYNTKKAQTTTAISEQIIKDIVSRWTGIPISKITGTEMDKLAHLEDIMHKRLIGQEDAVSSVAQAVRRGRAGLKSSQRPIGSFVFLGPTGTGKTELAKTLADILFGQEEAMIRFDMTEYMEKHEVAKLLGAPPGYVGYEEGGKLTEAVRRKPYSVVLFDEVEKAHPDIFNILLQVLDDGRLTDNKGHTVTFKNTVVICTSNIGSQVIQAELMKSGKDQIEEPNVLSTYTFSPRGREILTIGSKVFEKEGETGKWEEKMLLDYFAGQEITGEEKAAFPIHGFDTQAMSGSGVEAVTKAAEMYYRTSTTGKSWTKTTLIEYFKKGVVINALPDAPDEQLPTASLKTHCFSPDENETVTYKDRYWKRKMNADDWQTGFLKDYFEGQTIEKGTFPTTYWDIHTFSPAGKEIIVVGEVVWFRMPTETRWTMQRTDEYFGKDFPLQKQVEEKLKVDDEIEKKKFGLLKEKVMAELHKFFRPELINRFDEVIMFEPLRFIHMKRIVEIQLKSVVKAMEEQDMGFSCTEAAVKEIVRNGFDPVFGARPLRRAIQKLVENPISSLIIEKKMGPGNQVAVDFDGQNFVFNLDKADGSASSSSKNAIKKYVCEVCANRFETEIIPNSTPICSKCASSKLQELYEDAGNAPPVKPEPEAPVQVQDPSLQPSKS
ncbi:ATP-dependent Clp protease ATP-binding subunit [Candidatus Roizmanbacteria bacterium]|nr:ATP-dependent Clp protease ATP-binding subunit [Candidatus Roizmanbacteria bacterium]